MKKRFALLSTLLLLLLAISIPAYAGSELNQKGKAPTGYTPTEKSQKIILSRAARTVGTTSYTLIDGVLKITGTGEMNDYDEGMAPWYQNRQDITSIVVEEGITKIGSKSFEKCENVTSVELPESLKNIGEAAFLNCFSLSNIRLPGGVKEIQRGTFVNCTDLQNITYGNITTIKDYAFEGCPINNIYVPKSLSNISGKAFFDSPIGKFTVDNGNNSYSEQDGILMNKKKTSIIRYPAGMTQSTYKVPNGVTLIGPLAFQGTKNLKSVNLNSVTMISQSGFQSSGLESVTLPNTLRFNKSNEEDENWYTFYDCESLKSVKFGNSMKKTYYYMFAKCSALTTIDFGTSELELNGLTFAYCTSLKNVTLPSNVKKIGNGAFGECTSLESFTSKGIRNDIPFQALMNCEVLKTVNLNEGVKNINRASFCGCTSLSKVTIPSSVNFVHDWSFEKETKITCKNKNLIKYGRNGFICGEHVTISGKENYDYAYKVLTLVNKERSKRGLKELVMESSLLKTAMQRAAESSICFSHTRPDSSSCFVLNEKMVAENIAIGQQTPEAVVNSWMKSPGHKANILLKEATTIGIGSYNCNGTYAWVQNFGTSKQESSFKKPSNQTKKYKILIDVDEFHEAVTGYDTNFSLGGGTDYKFEIKLQLSSSKIYAKKQTKATAKLINPGFGVYVPFTGELVFTSSAPKVAAASKYGTITGVKAGSTTISAKTKYLRSSLKLSVITEKLTVPKVQILSAKRSKGTNAVVTIKKVSGAKGYEYRIGRDIKVSKNIKKAIKSTTKNTFTKLSRTGAYYVKVRAYKVNSAKKIVYGSWSKVYKIK